MPNNLLKLEGEASERYKIIRSYNYGKDLNVYKAHEVNKPRSHYVIKSFNTHEGFRRESQMLGKLNGAKNIMQMVDSYPSQEIIVCECALYDMETFLGHQDYTQRNEEKGKIIQDIVSGLSELHKHKIVHTELAPKNVMYFQEKDGYSESWKLIDFDTACFADIDYVKITMNYSAPEVIRKHGKGLDIKANFAMDMFSFGLILYFLETGHHYWDGKNEEIKEEMISEKFLPLRDFRDPVACLVIKQLLSKNVLNRMRLEMFKRSKYYTSISENGINNPNLEEPANINVNDEYELDETELQLYQAKLTEKTFQDFLEKFHNEMKRSLREMNDKIDNCTRTIEDLSELTKKIPQWLIKVKNERTPRVFVMIPDRKDWKRPAMWFCSKPFRLLFVCEHKEKWHIPEQEGYKVLRVNQFIKKYGPWINLCLQTLSSVLRIMTSNIFPQGFSEILSTVFNIADNSDLMQHFQEIIDTVTIGVNNIIDEEPEFLPLSIESQIPHQIINATGLRELERFLDTQDCADQFGGLVQCVDTETQEILWLCDEHKDIYSKKPSLDTSRSKSIPWKLSDSFGPPQSSPSSTPPSSPSPSSPSPSSPEISPTDNPNAPKWDYRKFSKFDAKNSTDPLDPFHALEYVYTILHELVVNAIASERIHFKKDDLKKIARELDEYMNRFKPLSPHWRDKAQKSQFISILKDQVHLYMYFLVSIVRYCGASFVKKMTMFHRDRHEINSIIKAGESFNNHLCKLIFAMEISKYNSHKSIAIKEALDNFFNEPDLKINIDNDPSIIVKFEALSRWYRAGDRIVRIDNIVSPTEIQKDVLFKTSKQRLDEFTTVTGKSLSSPNNNFLCVMKEIRLYNDRELNDNDNIIKFCGYSIHNCKSTMFYDYADYGDLYKYFQDYHNSSENLLKGWKERIKLAWEISCGVKYLHDKMIIHLDLRSANILLKSDATGKTLIPKISNFIWSRYVFADSAYWVYPKIEVSPEEEVWKRWYDPDRLLNVKNLESCLYPSDVYSLGLLFWEIACCKEKNLPFERVPIRRLYYHLQDNNYEKLPDIPEEYQHWELLINKMWQHKPYKRCKMIDVVAIMQNLQSQKDTTDTTDKTTSFKHTTVFQKKSCTITV